MERAVCLSSGGLDSSACLHLLIEAKAIPVPVFINYGQLNRDREFAALSAVCKKLGIAQPVTFEFPSFGENIRTGLTDCRLDVFDEAFTPCRNLMFLVIASAYAYSISANSICIGLLSEETAIFPDQTDGFLKKAEAAIEAALGVGIAISAPLRDLRKAEVVALSNAIGLRDSYSCHAGGVTPCGKCIACLEYRECD